MPVKRGHHLLKLFLLGTPNFDFYEAKLSNTDFLSYFNNKLNHSSFTFTFRISNAYEIDVCI